MSSPPSRIPWRAIATQASATTAMARVVSLDVRPAKSISHTLTAASRKYKGSFSAEIDHANRLGRNSSSIKPPAAATRPNRARTIRNRTMHIARYRAQPNRCVPYGANPAPFAAAQIANRPRDERRCRNEEPYGKRRERVRDTDDGAYRCGSDRQPARPAGYHIDPLRCRRSVLGLGDTPHRQALAAS